MGKQQPSFRPGEISTVSGQGEVRGPRGGHTGIEVTLIKGHRVPPTPEPGQVIQVVDRTKNGSGQG